MSSTTDRKNKKKTKFFRKKFFTFHLDFDLNIETLL